jgi:hypothetical protein
MITGVRRIVLCMCALVLVMASPLGVHPEAQVRPADPTEKLPPIQPVYDGWYKNSDGTLTFSYGYYNRTNKPIEISKGPNNGFNPAPFDRGQPTVFQPGTERNTLLVTLPGDFNQNLVWTIVADGMKASTSEKGGLNPLYIISDVPPRVVPDNAPLRPESGPARIVKLSEATKLTATVRTNAPPGIKVTYQWSKRSGPGDVKFDVTDEPATSATFTAAGEYLVHLTVTRPSGMDTITGGADFKIIVQ